eukprot:6176297-Prymnesium_polylepis.1
MRRGQRATGSAKEGHRRFGVRQQQRVAAPPNAFATAAWMAPAHEVMDACERACRDRCSVGERTSR